jgi:D-alanine transaminase
MQDEGRTRQVWLDGRLVDERSASVSVYDRGFLFGDGVYELIRFFRAAPSTGTRRHGVAMDLHVERLRRSLGLARIAGFDASELPAICAAVLDANDLDDASVYVQVTRGAAGSRAHVPQGPMKPTVFATASACEPIEQFTRPAAIRAVTLEDLRWKMCRIKTISLMGNILALLDADERGASEALLWRTIDGVPHVGEGAYTNVFAVIDGVLVTPPVEDDPPILHGVTRADALALADRVELVRSLGAGFVDGLRTEVRPIPLDELRAADEILVTSSRRFASGVVELDGRPVGDGTVGPVTRAVFDLLRNDALVRTGRLPTQIASTAR